MHQTVLKYLSYNIHYCSSRFWLYSALRMKGVQKFIDWCS